MNKTKYFVIRYGELGEPQVDYDFSTLNEARENAERQAIAYPGQRFLIAAEVQSVVVETQVKWTDK